VSVRSRVAASLLAAAVLTAVPGATAGSGGPPRVVEVILKRSDRPAIGRALILKTMRAQGGRNDDVVAYRHFLGRWAWAQEVRHGRWRITRETRGGKAFLHRIRRAIERRGSAKFYVTVPSLVGGQIALVVIERPDVPVTPDPRLGD
jgi:hypothetical protein